MQIAVGGCLAQKDRAEITDRAPWVDVVFGTHNIGSLPALLERARVEQEAQVEIDESLEVFPSTLPTRRESPYAAWVAISVGCNNTCTFCIVPSLRGKEKDRRPGDVLAEIEALVDDGVLEVTLLGQNVNAYGAEFGDRLGVLQAAARVRRDRRPRAGAVHHAAPARLHRRRHRGDGRDAERHAAAAHAAAVRLRRRAARACAAPTAGTRYLGDHRPGARGHARTPRSRPTSSWASPARPSDDFADTLDVVRAGPVRRRLHLPVLEAARHPGRDDGRPGPAGGRRRSATSGWSRWSSEIALAENQALTGRQVEVLVAEGEGRKDGATRRMSGRAPDNRLVHFVPGGSAAPAARTRRPGQVTSSRPR